MTRTVQRAIQKVSEESRGSLQDLEIAARQYLFTFLYLRSRALTLLTSEASILTAICGAL